MIYEITYSGWNTIKVEAKSAEAAKALFWERGLNDLSDAVIDDIEAYGSEAYRSYTISPLCGEFLIYKGDDLVGSSDDVAGSKQLVDSLIAQGARHESELVGGDV